MEKKRFDMEKVNNKIRGINKSLLLIYVILTLGIFFLTVVLNINQASAQTSTWCAERTTDGAWCQNVPLEEVDQDYRSAQTSCESTSFCKLGTCVDGSEGLCSPNTPQQVCQQESGVWVEGKPEEIPQCQLGCCILGDEAAFVTQTRCSSLAGLYGLDTNFRSDIKTEAACIASAAPRAKGACVLDDGFSRNCRILTKSECQDLEATSSSNTTIEFHEGFLCSAESLSTSCGIPQNPRTTIVENKDEVYFLDTCGNVANIYDASKVNNQDYWTRIIPKAESCNPDSSNAGSATCGNCNYQLGSIGKDYERGNIQTPTQPRFGDFVCADLSCEYQGESYKHGETWCGNSPGTENNLPGSEYHRLVCYNGEVTIEQCSAFRQEVCIEGAIETTEGDFSTAQCRANRWQDCVVQDNKVDCENADKRDCRWIEGQSLLKDDSGLPLVVNEEGNLIPKSDGDDERQGAACVPLYAPGLDFWNPEGEAEQLCLVASRDCVVRFEKKILGSWECQENCECVGLKKGGEYDDIKEDTEWAKQMNNMCVALGDCGQSTNYIGIQGHNNGKAIRIESVAEE